MIVYLMSVLSFFAADASADSVLMKINMNQLSFSIQRCFGQGQPMPPPGGNSLSSQGASVTAANAPEDPTPSGSPRDVEMKTVTTASITHPWGWYMIFPYATNGAKTRI